MKDELVLVTGGAGFIGSHLCEALLAEGYRVRVVDDLSVGRIENIPSACQFIQGNILDETLLSQAMKDVGAVCHEAARVTIRGSVEKFADDAETNLLGTLKVLKHAGASGVRRFVYASSMAVYGDSETPNPINERYSTDAISPYGISKLAAEKYLLMVAPSFGIEPVILRYFNTFGTRQTFTPYVGVITIFITRLLQHQPITIFGDGTQTRDFVHVSDIVQANLLALETSATEKAYNIGTGRGTSVKELAALLTERLFPSARIDYEPARTEELRNSVADITLAETHLGYSSKTNLQSQINEVINFLRH